MWQLDLTRISGYLVISVMLEVSYLIRSLESIFSILTRLQTGRSEV